MSNDFQQFISFVLVSNFARREPGTRFGVNAPDEGEWGGGRGRESRPRTLATLVRGTEGGGGWKETAEGVEVRAAGGW